MALREVFKPKFCCLGIAFVFMILGVTMLPKWSSVALSSRLEMVAASNSKLRMPHRNGSVRGISSGIANLSDKVSIPMSYRNGFVFNVSEDLLRRLIIPPKNFITLNNDTFNQFVFATAASINHFQESRDAVASVQAHFPHKVIYYYDIGLHDGIKPWTKNHSVPCGVIYRRFNFSLYPEHVRNLTFYAWKWLIVQEVLREHPGVFWMDASIRFRSNKLHVYRDHLMNTGTVLLFSLSSHSNYVVTNPMMYSYLPTNVERQKSTRQWEANNVLVFNTHQVYWKFLHWAYLCSLTEMCIAPVYQLHCNFTAGDRRTAFAHCHRYDQAMINLLLSNWWLNQEKFYTAGTSQHILSVVRGPSSQYNLQMCERNQLYPHV